MEPRIKTDKHYTNDRRMMTRTWFIAAVDGVWLVRKDGGLRLFKTRHAAKIAARTEAEKVTA